MAVITTVSLADGKPTPVSHSFVPVSRDSTTVTYQDRSSGKPMAYLTLSTQFRGPISKTSRAYKVNFRLVQPHVAVVGTGDAEVDTLAYQNLFSVDFVFHEASTLQERKDLIALLHSALSDASLSSMVTDAAPLFG